MTARIVQGIVLGTILIYIAAIISPESFDQRIIQSIYSQKDAYNKNEFQSEEERSIYESVDQSSSEKDKYQIFEKLQNLNPKKELYKSEKNHWKQKFDELEKKRLAEEKRIAEENRLARLEREKQYAEVRRRDGIISQSQAFDRCSRELRARTNSGYYMQFSEDRMRREMKLQLNSCMYKYGYFGYD